MDAPTPDVPEDTTTPIPDLVVPTPDAPTGDVGPSRGAPTLRITEPAAGTTLREPTALRFTLNAPDGIYALALLRDGVVAGVTYARVASLTVDPSLAPAGEHLLEVRLVDTRGRTASDSVRLRFDAPPIRAEEVSANESEYRDGDEVVLDARFSAAGLDLSADFSAMDSGFAPSGVTVTDLGGGQYSVRYRISAGNSRADGEYTVALTARDRARPDAPLRVPVVLRLANTPLLPFVPEGGSVERTPPPGGSAVSAVGTPPRVDGITGDHVVAPGGSATLDVRWTARAGVPLRVLQVTAEGFAGHAALPLADGTSGRTALRLALSLAERAPTGAVSLRVRALDAAGTATPWVPYALTVEALGRGGPGTVNLGGRVRFRHRVVATEVPCALLGAAAYNEMAWLTAPAQVEVVRVSDGTVVATTTTNAAGNYAVAFVSGAASYRVRVSAFVGAAASPALRVVDRAAMQQRFTSASFAVPGPGAVTQNVDITGNAAGAFAILRVLEGARTASLAQIGGVLPALTVEWQNLTDASAGCGSPISCYSNAGPILYVGGQAADPDQWDLPVLRHEYGHYLMARRSVDDTPGGAHGPAQQVDPRLAWSEGVASFWGSVLSGNSCYYDFNTNGGFTSPVDQGPPATALNTTPVDDPTGNISEGVVSGALWQLSRLSAFVPPLDPLAPLRFAIFTWLPTAGRGNVGAAGTDLTDALHGWLCPESCKVAEMRHVVIGTWRFDYRNPDSYAHCPAPYLDAAGAPLRCSGNSDIALAGAMVRVNLSGGSVTRAPLAGDPLGVLNVGTLPRQLAVVRGTGPGPTRAVVTSFGDGTLSLVSVLEGSEREIDWDDNPMTTSAGAAMGITRVSLGAMSAPRGVGVSPTGRYAFVALSGTDQVAVLDLDRKVACETFPVPRPAGEPAGASVPDQVVFLPDNSSAYVSLIGSASLPGSSLAIVNVRNATDCMVLGNEISGYVTDLGGHPRPFTMALNPSATRLAVAGFGNDRVIVVDVATGVPIDLYPSDPARRFFEAGQVPTALTWTSTGAQLFWGTIAGRSDTSLLGLGVLAVGTLADGRSSYDVGANAPVYSMVLSADDATLYVGDSRGGISALATSLFSGSPGLPVGSRTGGCLDARGRAIACPVSYTVPGGGAGVRSLVRFGP
jgi:hypothetical protein